MNEPHCQDCDPAYGCWNDGNECRKHPHGINEGVLSAVRHIENHFKLQGVAHWELSGICSRNLLVLERTQNRVADAAFQLLFEESKKQCDAMIQKIIDYVDFHCDSMEGADGKSFIEHEHYMCGGMDILKLFGIKYDPITGKREIYEATTHSR